MSSTDALSGPTGNSSFVDLNDPICAVCESGGDMICCDGKCFRSFHPKCIGLRDEDIPEDCPFVCSDCFNRVHRCFKCKHFDVEEDLVKCSVPYCGKFYHTKCIGGESDSNNICNLHFCNDCGEKCLQFQKRNSLCKCFRCPKAFDLKHRPRDVHILAGEYFLCIKHVNEDESVPELSKEVEEKIIKRNKETSRRRPAPKKFETKIKLPGTGNGSSSSSDVNYSLASKNMVALPPRLSAVSQVTRTTSDPLTNEAESHNKAVNTSDIIIARKKRPLIVDSADIGLHSNEEEPLYKFANNGKNDESIHESYQSRDSKPYPRDWHDQTSFVLDNNESFDDYNHNGSYNESFHNNKPYSAEVHERYHDNGRIDSDQGYNNHYFTPQLRGGYFFNENIDHWGGELQVSNYSSNYYAQTRHNVSDSHTAYDDQYSSQLRKHNDFRKRRARPEKNYNAIYSYGTEESIRLSDSMGRTNAILRYTENADLVSSQSELIVDHSVPLRESLGTMGRTSALLRSVSSSSNSSDSGNNGIYSSNTSISSRATASNNNHRTALHHNSQQSGAVAPLASSSDSAASVQHTKAPAVPAEPVKKMDAGDLFAMLMANGLLSSK